MKGARRIGRIHGSGSYQNVKCRQCGEYFPITCRAESWPFKYTGNYLCSWSCLRRYEAAHPRARNSIWLDYLA